MKRKSVVEQRGGRMSVATDGYVTAWLASDPFAAAEQVAVLHGMLLGVAQTRDELLRECGTLKQRLAAAEAERDECHDLLRTFWKHWDCDSDAHKYGSPCRCCEAEELLNKHEAKGGRE